jgi:methyl-accepting chemotaxis protein
MKNLKIWQKLALLAALFMVPLLVVTYNLVATVESQGVMQSRVELDGLDHALPVLALIGDLQQHRRLSSQVAAGSAASGTLAAQSLRLQNGLRRIDELYALPGADPRDAQRWQTLHDRIAAAVSAAGPPHSVDASRDEHGLLIDDLRYFIFDLADSSGLLRDPDRGSYHLVQALLRRGPELGEYLARADVLVAEVRAAGRASPEQTARLSSLDSSMAVLADQLDQSVAKVFAAEPGLKPGLRARADAVAGRVRASRDRIRGVPADARFDAGAASVAAPQPDALALLQAAEAPILTGLLQQRIEKSQRRIAEILAWAGFAVIAVLVIGFYIVRDITAPLGQVVEVANQIALGNLNVETISGRRKDEIGVLSRAFDQMISSLREQVLLVQDIAAGDLTGTITPQSANDDMGNALVDMVAHLSGLVSEVHKSGIQVNTSATQISATARQQHSTASEIAATTTQIGATSKEISATSKELVRTMAEVTVAAEQSASLAGSGQAGLTQMEETMSRVMDATGSVNAKLAVLNEKAGNITQVVTTITRVADQTNLLSLNAAIEAEKAGEYGRGFSVVATEIRRLADQTAVATYDIEQMVKEIQSAVSAGVMGMDKFSEEVRRGMDEVQQVGGQLSQIIHQVQQMAPRCEAASEGMQAQAIGAEQITQALSQLSEAAVQTVESLRQSNQAIDGLHQSASGLREGVSRFKLGG